MSVPPEEIRCSQCNSALPPGAPAGHCPRCLMQTLLNTPEAPPEIAVTDGPWTTFGGLELYEEIGRGGMGVVYRARQAKLDRSVAVKVLLRAQFAGREERERFHREAQAAARLQHPGIVSVYEVGEDEGMPWFSMEHIPGRSLEQVVREHPMSAQSAAECVKKIASALQHAHEHGVLHRDLKPSNILLDAEGEPRITDFGIARIVSSETTTNRQAELTRTGQSLGSPGYAAPEQALHGKADARTDVYGLGALLYHLLTGRPPFQGPTLDAILVQLRESDPLPPHKLNPALPRDLETICLHCLNKTPEARYDTARAVEEDLHRFLEGRPVSARPLGRATLAWRWLCRHPAIGVMLAIIALLIVGIIAGSIASARYHQRQERRTALIAEARQHRQGIGAGARTQALAALREAWDIAPSASVRDEFIATLAMHEVALSHAIHPGDPLHKPVPTSGSGDGRFTTRHSGESVIVTEKSTGREVARIEGYKLPPILQLDDRGARIAIAPQVGEWEPGEVIIHDLPSGRLSHRMKHPHAVLCMDWSGEFLATGTAVGRLIYIWDTRNGERLHRFSGHNNDIEALLFRPGGQELVSLAADGAVHVWHSGRGMEVLRLERVGQHGAPAWWGEDGRQLYSRRKNSREVDVIQFDWSDIVKTLSPGKQEPRSENLPSIHADKDGGTCAAVDETGCRVWDWRHGCLATFIPKDGSEWMTARVHHDTGLWISSWNQPLRKRHLHRDAAGWLTISPHEPSMLGSGPLLVAQRADGMAFASTQNEADEKEDRVVVWWPREDRSVSLPQRDPYYAALSPDGRWCVTGSFTADDEALLWSLPDGKLQRRLPHKGIISGLAFVRNGALLWLWGNETLQCLNTTTWRSARQPMKAVQGSFTVSDDGLLAARFVENKVLLHETSQLNTIAELPVPGTSGHVSLSFSGDGAFLFIHIGTGEIMRWDVRATESGLEKAGLILHRNSN
jgi:eukaryotic-like serine/threonine-protein kinase